MSPPCPKNLNGQQFTYYYDGDKLTQMTRGSETLYFTYDAAGNPATMSYSGQRYYYVLNLQGDVVGILDSLGRIVTTYTYDAWGNTIQISGEMADTFEYINPFRYRGYVYDYVTGLYYLQSRYYNPQIGRWINADNQIAGVGGEVLGYNMFAYCMNNPVNMSDPFGNWPIWNDVANFGKKVVDFVVQGFLYTLNPVGTIVTTTLHYNRNILNKTDYTQEELGDPLPESKSKFHQNNKKDNKNNKKYVIGEWFSSEVVYYSDGTINSTPEDEGTFNVYSGSDKVLNIAVHGIFDVVPYMVWGNRLNDSTTIIDRFIMIFQ